MEIVAESSNDGFARRALRAVATLLLLGLAASGPLLYFAAPHAKTTASLPLPPLSRRGFLDGSYMKTLEVHLRESSYLTGYLRGLMAEGLWLTGLLDAERVHSGKDGWLFLRYGLNFDPVWFEEPKYEFEAKRRAFFSDLARNAKAADIAILVAVVPDKDRIYPEKCWASGAIPAVKQGLYTRLQLELAQSGLECVDGATAMESYKREHPNEWLFHPLDTHWTLTGANVFARAIAAKIAKLGWQDRLGPPAQYLKIHVESDFATDLVRMLGFRSGGRLERSLTGRHWGDMPTMPDGSPVQIEQPQALVMLAGTSYSANGLQLELPLVLDRAVDLRGVIEGRGPFPGLAAAAALIAQKQVACRLIVWEWPERSVLEGGVFPSGEQWGWLHAPRQAPSLR